MEQDYTSASFSALGVDNRVLTTGQIYGIGVGIVLTLFPVPTIG